jgi:hypothetical protein
MSEALALVIAALIAATASGVGAGVNASEAEGAKAEAKAMNQDEMAYEKKLTEAQMRQHSREFTFNKDVTNRQLAETQRMDTANITSDHLKRIEGFLNNNTGLQQILLSRWGGK